MQQVKLPPPVLRQVRPNPGLPFPPVAILHELGLGNLTVFNPYVFPQPPATPLPKP